MKAKAENLTKQQIVQAWNWCKLIDGQDGRFIRQDALGAVIKYTDYDSDTEYGWCIEYLLSPTFLESKGISTNSFCEENVRVLFLKNYNANIDAPVGKYRIHYTASDNRTAENCPINESRFAWQESSITDDGKIALQNIFGLSDDLMHTIFPS